MPFAPANGIQLYYEVHGLAIGSAPAVVFAHGAGGNHLSWWQQVPAFRDRFTCVTFDHRAFGQSSDLTGAGGGAFVEDLRALLDHLGIERTHLVAQSMGGWTCLGFALKYPTRVHKLVMSDTHGGLRGPGIDFGVARAALKPLPPGVHAGLGTRAYTEQPALAFLYQQISDLNPVRTPEELGALLRSAGSPTVDDLQGYTTPTLFIIGEEDASIPAPVLEAAAKLVPGAVVERFPQSGHSVYFERAERYNTVVEAFLRA